MFLPPQRASREVVDKIVDITAKIARALNVTGPLNVQLLLTPAGEIKVIEANVRASRSVPFVSKMLNTSFAAAMVSAFLGPAHAPFSMSPPKTPDVRGGCVFYDDPLGSFEALPPPRTPPIGGGNNSSNNNVHKNPMAMMLPPAQHDASSSNNNSSNNATVAVSPSRIPAGGKFSVVRSTDSAGRPNRTSMALPSTPPMSGVAAANNNSSSSPQQQQQHQTSPPFVPAGGKFSVVRTTESAGRPSSSSRVSAVLPSAPPSVAVGGDSASAVSATSAASTAAAALATPTHSAGRPSLDKIVQPSIMDLPFVAVKTAMFSFDRLSCADPILGVEMASTGEVAAVGRDADEALLLSMAAVCFKVPAVGSNILVDTNDAAAAERLAPFIAKAAKHFGTIYATEPAAAVLRDKLKASSSSSLESKVVSVHQPPRLGLPVRDGAEPNVKTLIHERRISLTIQTRDRTLDFLLRRMQLAEAPEEYWVRRLSVDYGASLITEENVATAFLTAYSRFAGQKIEVFSYSAAVERPLEQRLCEAAEAMAKEQEEQQQKTSAQN